MLFECRMYIRLLRSFSKQEPPKPSEHCRYLLPILSSAYTMALTEETSQPGVNSHNSVSELIELTL